MSVEFIRATVYLHFSGLFLKLKLATLCNSLFYIVFSAADKVVLPHLQRTSELHDRV